MRLNRCEMQLSRALFLSLDRTMYHGANSVSVVSLARESSYQRLREGRSTGLSFHWRKGSSKRASSLEAFDLLESESGRAAVKQARTC